MCWVEKECAHMLLQHLVLGFELELVCSRGVLHDVLVGCTWLRL